MSEGGESTGDFPLTKLVVLKIHGSALQSAFEIIDFYWKVRLRQIIWQAEEAHVVSRAFNPA